MERAKGNSERESIIFLLHWLKLSSFQLNIFNKQ